MTKFRHLAIVLAGCFLASGAAGSASAQPWMDRDWDRQDRDWRDRDWRDRDRGWERGQGWERGRGRAYGRGGRFRDRDCYYVQRRGRDRFGDVVIRRYRVCED